MTYSGVILNSRNIPDEVEHVKEALKEIGGEIVSVVPRDSAVQVSENQGKTVLEALPESEMAGCYRNLAKRIIELTEDE